MEKGPRGQPWCVLLRTRSSSWHGRRQRSHHDIPKEFCGWTAWRNWDSPGPQETARTWGYSQVETIDYRSTVGSLQLLATQSRSDLAFEVSQIQKRVPYLQVADLIRANQTVREAKSNPFHITPRDISKDWDLWFFHDAGLCKSVGVEIDEEEADDVLFKTVDKKLVYSIVKWVLLLVLCEKVLESLMVLPILLTF